MDLQTPIPIQKHSNQISYDSHVLLLGSCFAQNMGEKLRYFKFRQLQNPFGILFHPLAIEQLVSGAVRGESYSKDDMFQLNGLWHCFDAHSELSDPSPEKLLIKLNNALEATKVRMANASHIIVTLGTAWVYRHIESGGVVANCHKVPQKEFAKELLPINHIADSLRRIFQLVLSVNPSARFILTISPVRHLKDGFSENQRSKAHLISAVHQVLENYQNGSYQANRSERKVTNDKEEQSEPNSVISKPVSNGKVAYFPSYEIMMDELRDYRFYKRDMVHPNSLAIDYIWEKFRQVCIAPAAFPTMGAVATVQKGLQHRPFQPDSTEHRKFRESLERKIAALKGDYPFMEF